LSIQIIGVDSYGARASLNFQLYFLVTSEPHKL